MEDGARQGCGTSAALGAGRARTAAMLGRRGQLIAGQLWSWQGGGTLEWLFKQFTLRRLLCGICRNIPIFAGRKAQSMLPSVTSVNWQRISERIYSWVNQAAWLRCPQQERVPGWRIFR